MKFFTVLMLFAGVVHAENWNGRVFNVKSNSEISIILGITERTVRAHVSSVFDKLKITDRLMLALKFHGIK